MRPLCVNADYSVPITKLPDFERVSMNDLRDFQETGNLARPIGAPRASPKTAWCDSFWFETIAGTSREYKKSASRRIVGFPEYDR